MAPSTSIVTGLNTNPGLVIHLVNSGWGMTSYVHLTGSGQWQLRVDMEDWENQTAWSAYGQFAVSDDKYTLHVGSYDNESTAGDSMTYHNGYPFTTKDQDNDAKSV